MVPVDAGGQMDFAGAVPETKSDVESRKLGVAEINRETDGKDQDHEHDQDLEEKTAGAPTATAAPQLEEIMDGRKTALKTYIDEIGPDAQKAEWSRRGKLAWQRRRERAKAGGTATRAVQAGTATPVSEAPRLAVTALIPEAVNHPSHYGGANDPYEAIKVIEAWHLDFCLGNVVKYIARAGRKSGTTTMEDLRKAQWYLDREIGSL
jgi:hypothetical protein